MFYSSARLAMAEQESRYFWLYVALVAIVAYGALYVFAVSPLYPTDTTRAHFAPLMMQMTNVSIVDEPLPGFMAFILEVCAS